MSHTLLIADQDETLCHTLGSELAADGYHVLTAAAAGALALQLENLSLIHISEPTRPY